ncbi:MAG TPA: hypothetical protein VGN10_07045 [Pyrinomonadaceae bacterium]|jgi:hypothetical protein
MSTLNLSKFKLLLIGCICLGLVFGIVVWAAGKKTSTSEALKIRVLTQTKNVSITELLPRKEGSLTLKITNESQQSVLAYTLSLGRSNEITSFSFSLAPGDSRNEQITVSNLEEIPGDKSAREVTLAAVYLADGTTDGNPKYTLRLQNRMLGMLEQADRSLSALYASTNSTESDSGRLIQNLTDALSKSDEIIDSSYVPSERLAGRALIKEKVTRDLNELNNKKGASIQKVKDQIKTFTRDIEETSGSRHIRKEKGEQK